MEQQRLVDALTAETMTLREDAASLQVRQSLLVVLTPVYYHNFKSLYESCLFPVGWSQAVVQKQTAELEQKLDTVMLVMAGLGLLETHTDPIQDCDFEAGGPHSFCLCFYGYMIIGKIFYIDVDFMLYSL